MQSQPTLVSDGRSSHTWLHTRVPAPEHAGVRLALMPAAVTER